jgi:hypothetical protein
VLSFMSISTPARTPRARLERAIRLAPEARLRLPALTRSRQALLAFAGYLAYALYTTWPWVLHPTNTVYGVVGGDLTSGVASFQEYAREWQLPFLPGTLHYVNAPEGVPTDWALHLAAVGSDSVLWVLSVAFGGVAAFGILAVLGFTGSAFAMFLFARALTGHAGVAFVVGLAFGFWPYTYTTGWTWPQYTQTWVFVLLLWRMLVVAQKPTLRNGLFAGLAATAAMSWLQYYLLIGGVVYGTLGALALLRAAVLRQLWRQLAAQVVGAVIVIAFFASLLVAARINGYSGIPVRTEADAIANSARPLMYVIPGPNNPVFGDLTKPYLMKKFAGPLAQPPTSASYADIYLGVSLLLIAAAGAWLTLVRLWRLRLAALSDRAGTAGLTALLLGMVGFAFSAPPKVSVLGFLVPMPYSVLTRFTEVFRVAHRFAIVVMLAACLLAALALASLVRGRSLRLQAAILAAVALIFAVDLRADPVPRISWIVQPNLYKVLAREPPGIVAQYPLSPQAIALNEESLRSGLDRHPIFDGFAAGSASGARKVELTFLLARRTVPDLAGYGVRYVIVRHGVPGAALPRLGQRVPGLRTIASDGKATLYRVVAPPPLFTSYGGSGFHTTEGKDPGVRWLAENGGRLDLFGRCRPCSGHVSFRVGSFARPRLLVIRDEAGHVVLRRKISKSSDSGGQRVLVPVRFSGRSFLSFRTDPPPEPVNLVLGGIDARPFGVFVGQPVRFIPDRVSPATSLRLPFAPQ